MSFANDIAPIIYTKCASCHHKGGVAPFALISYDQVKRHAKMIKLVTEIKYMPPLKADPQYARYANYHTLTDQEIALISRWVKLGANRGEGTEKPYSEYLTSSKSVEWGKPDLVVKLDSFLHQGDNKERFIIYRKNIILPSDTTVCHCEFEPGNKKIIHHMDAFIYHFTPQTIFANNTNIITEDTFRTEYAKNYYLKMFNHNGTMAIKELTSVVDYFPGALPVTYPAGIAKTFKIKQKSAIVVSSVHYGFSSAPEWDKSLFKFWYCKKSPKRKILTMVLGSPDHPIKPALELQPNEAKKCSTRINVAFDISMVSIQPHMHLIGRRFKSYALTPTGDTIRLIRIHDWDFRWQRSYKYKYPVKIPKGSIIYAEAWYDNTTNNPYNPSHPPQKVGHSIHTKDEMLQLWLFFMPYQQGDEKLSLE